MPNKMTNDQAQRDAVPTAAAASTAGSQRISELWMRSLDSIEPACLIFDPRENYVIHFNRGLLELTGLSGQQLSEHRPSELFPEQLSLLSGFTLECLATGRAWSSALSLRAHDGRHVPVEIYGSTVSDADRDLLMFLCFDMKLNKVRRAKVEIDQFYRSGQPHERRFDQVFRELERGNQLILHAAGEGIYGVDAKGRITFVNPAAERMLGWKADEVIGRNAHALLHHSHANGDPYPHRACPIYAAFKQGSIFRVDDEVFWRKDGHAFPVEYTSTPIQERGRPLGAVVVFRDVTAQRKARAELETALNEVEALKHRLEQENAYLQDELHGANSRHEIVGASWSVKHIISQIELVAPTTATVLITGESGTGKELIARAIHYASDRARRPLIRVNCASIPRDLFESEFFGHVRGAFTGAIAQRTGRFELADGGTIFLDEVGEIPLELQGKLLRILQEQQFERVGDPSTREIDVRVIAATNRDLAAEVRAKRFREDLYFRLNVFPVHSPPLRDRLDDIGMLATLFIQRACERMNKPVLSISKADVERLRAYSWPGNIRELQNVIERAVIISTAERLQLDIPIAAVTSFQVATGEGSETDFAFSPVHATLNAVTANAMPDRSTISPHGVIPEHERRTQERANIMTALRQAGGKVAGPGGAASLLGVRSTTLYSRIKRHQIDTGPIKRERDSRR